MKVQHGQMSTVFINGPGEQGSIPGQIIPETQKMILDAALLSTQYYKVRINGKVEQSLEWSSTPTLHLGVVAIEKGAFRSPSTKVTNFTHLLFVLKSNWVRMSWKCAKTVVQQVKAWLSAVQ